MARKKLKPEELSIGERVVATVAMPGIPEGTKGTVSFVAGFTWIRYWIRFDNGEYRGSVNRNKLARPDEWEDIKVRRARQDEEEPEEAERELVTVGGGEEAAGTADGDQTVNGVSVPGHLLERAKLRREALGK